MDLHALQRLSAAAIAGTAAFFIGPAAAAGQLELSYRAPERFSDAGRSVPERERALAAISRHIESLARRLPDGQTLRIVVTDIDLAGDLVPTSLRDLRVLRGGADRPAIDLHYTLSESGRSLRSSADHIVDLDYLSAPPRSRHGGELDHEKRMLSRWFDQRFGAALP